MKRLAAWFRRIPLSGRIGGLVALLVVAGLLVWFFLLKGPGPVVIVQQPPARPALGKVITFDDYRNAITAARTDVGAAQSAVGDERKKTVQKAIAELEGVEGASVLPGGANGNGRPSQVDNTLLLVELGRNEPNLSAVEAALSVLGDSLTAGSAASLQGTLAGEQSIAELNKTLSDPIFDYTRTESPLQRLARWLASATGEADPGDTLWRWFLAISAALAAGALTFLGSEKLGNRWARLGLSVVVGLVVGTIFFFAVEALDVTVGLLGVLGLIVAAVAVWLMTAGLNRASSPASVRPVSELAQVLGMSAVEARRRAEEAAGAGDYRSAIRYRCLAVLLLLDEAGMLVFDRTATNREYLFRAPGTIHDDLQPLLDRFEQVWYGGAETSAEEWAGYTARAAAIEARVADEVRGRTRAA
ncbi:MAG: DUF4129 domain-containing protein [Chloroflexota bacterium]